MIFIFCKEIGNSGDDFVVVCVFVVDKSTRMKENEGNDLELPTLMAKISHGISNPSEVNF